MILERMNKLDNSFGNYIKALRKSAGISSKQLASMLSRAPAYISQIENGRNKNPNYSAAYQILSILGVKEDMIEHKLHTFHIYSPEYYEAEAELAEKHANDPEYQEHMLQQARQIAEQESIMNKPATYWGEPLKDDWFNWFQTQDTSKQIIEIKATLDHLANSKAPNNTKLISNIYELVTKMRNDKELFEFFSELFKEDYTVFSFEKRNKIIKAINKEIREGF